MPILKLFTPTFTSPSFRTGGVIYIIQIVLINVSCDSFTISKPYDTLFWSFCYHHRLLCSLMHTLQKATSPIFKILWCVALSLGQHFLWAHALDFPWLDAWLETFDSRIFYTINERFPQNFVENVMWLPGLNLWMLYWNSWMGGCLV